MNNKIAFPKLASLLADSSGRSKRFSEDFLREFFALISESLEAGNSVKVKGLGTFRLSRVEPRKSVDVTTGQPMEISGHSKVVFIPAKELADAVNAPFEAFSAVEIADDVDISSLVEDEDILIQDDATDILLAMPAVSDGSVESDSSVDDDIVVAGTGIDGLRSDSVSEESVLEEAAVAVPPVVDKSGDCDGPDASDTAAEFCTVGAGMDVESEMVADDGAAADDIAADAGFAMAGGDIDDLKFDGAGSGRGEESGRGGKRTGWPVRLLLCAGCALLAVVLAIAAWMFVGNSDQTASDRVDGVPAGMAASGDAAGDMSAVSEVVGSESASDAVGGDSASDAVQGEDAVPTAPSDRVVYDTIGNARYLTTMAKSHYGNNKFWPYIYEENKDRIGHPDRIRPGTPIVIPQLSKYGIDPDDPQDVEKAVKLGREIYARYGKII